MKVLLYKLPNTTLWWIREPSRNITFVAHSRAEVIAKFQGHLRTMNYFNSISNNEYYKEAVELEIPIQGETF
jgi:hypothetical protein